MSDIKLTKEQAGDMLGSGFIYVSDMTVEELEVQYKLIQEKKSKLSAQIRMWVENRYEFEVLRKEIGDL